MTISKDDKPKIEDFFNKVTGWDQYNDGFIEVVVDYTTSRYFNHKQLDELIEYSIQMSSAGCEVHFGPSLRKEDLGSQRSGLSNILWAKTLWVDVDAPDKTLPVEQQREDTKKLLQSFADTLKTYEIEPSYVVHSGHGVHMYFLLQRVHMPPGETWRSMENALITLGKADPQAKDPTRLLRVPGTRNYKVKDQPRDVKMLHASETSYQDDSFNGIVRDFGKELTFIDPSSRETKPLGFMPPCIKYLLDPQNKPAKGYRHQVRVVLGTFGFHEGWKIDEMIQKVLHTTDDPKKAEKDIRGVYSTLERDSTRYTVGCKEGSSLRSLVDGGITVCDKENCQFEKVESGEKEGKKEIPSAWFDGLVDLVLDDQGKIAYLVKDGVTLVLKDKHETAEGVLIPPPRVAILWRLPRGSEVIRHFSGDSDGQLFEDLVEYHKGISELPDDNHYRYLAAWDMHTYLFQSFEYSPINWLYAIPERGKSRTGKACTYVAWRGVHLITLNEPHVIRLATDHKATIFFDMMDLWRKLEKTGSEDIILCRFEQGVKMPKVIYPERGAFQDTVYYDIYGPTTIATNEPVDQILETRSVQMIMPESSREFEDDIKPEHGLPFRERLEAFRARWMNRELPQVDKPVIGRLGDILRPIRQIVSMVCQDETWFLNFAQDLEKLRKEERSESFEAQVVRAILRAKQHVEHGHLLHARVLDIINENRPERYRISPQKLGRISKKLGFEKYFSGEARGIYYDEQLINRLCRRFGIEEDNHNPMTI